MSGLDDIDIICAGYQELGSEFNPPASPRDSRITTSHLTSKQALDKTEKSNSKKIHQESSSQSTHLKRGQFQSKRLKESPSQDVYEPSVLDSEDEFNTYTVSSLTPLTVNVISSPENLRSSFDPHKLAEQRAGLKLDLNGRSNSRMNLQINSLFKAQPKDPCNSVYLALLLAGVGFLLPYNSFVSAVDYYQDKFPGTTVIFDMRLVDCLGGILQFINLILLAVSFTLWYHYCRSLSQTFWLKQSVSRGGLISAIWYLL